MKTLTMPRQIQKDVIEDLLAGKDAYTAISLDEYIDCHEPVEGDLLRDPDNRVTAKVTEIYIAYGGWVGILMETVEVES